MISLTPIPNRIQKRLFEKMKVLGRTSTYPNNSSNGVLTHDKMATRSTFLRMTSGQTNPVILTGGKLKDDGNTSSGYDDIYGPRIYSVRDEENIEYNEAIANTIFEGIQTLEESTDVGTAGSFRSSVKSEVFSNKNKRPMPGVKSIDVSFKGGVKALREATISWTCWDWKELDYLMPHFLAHGKTVMVEWGWVYDNTTLQDLPDFIREDPTGDKYISVDAYNNYRNKVINADGDFDLMVGVIKNFEYTTREDGGFDCQTIISSVGVSIINNIEPNKSIISPSTIYDLSLKEDKKDIETKLKNSTGDDTDNLIKLDTTVSFKAFLYDLDRFIARECFRKPETRENAISFRSPDSDVNFPDSSILYEKNKFIVAKTGKLVDKLGNDNSDWWANFRQGEIWVRWGWFEDNVLSKFLSVTSEDPENPIITEFRSVERVLTSDGEEKDPNKSDSYESTVIRNHELLETVNISSYILPGQFFPLEERVIKDDEDNDIATLDGDSEKLITLYNLTRERENFEPFVTDEASGHTPFKFGYLRNMLISTKLIRAAFGVDASDKTIEPKDIFEGIQELFNMLNQELNFWNFDLTVDETDTHRVKIVDTSTTKVDFTKPITGQRSKVLPNGEVFTIDNQGNRGNEGVFYFPVWQYNSLVKQQNVTAKIPSSMQLAAMYGSNVDAMKGFGNIKGGLDPAGVIAGGLTNDVKDRKQHGLDIAIKNNNSIAIGQRDGDSTKPITIKGGDDSVYNYLKNNLSYMSKKRLNTTYNIIENTEKDQDIQNASLASQVSSDDYDPSLPPPMPRFMEPDEWKLLFDKDSDLYKDLKENEKNKTIVILKAKFGQKFIEDESSGGRMKTDFLNNVNKSITFFGTSNEESLPIIIPLELEIDIDGIGGIYPANSFHSEYLPNRYKTETVFQAMDVDHKLDSSGWTTTLRGIMRSTLGRTFSSSTVEFKDFFENEKKRLQGKRDKWVAMYGNTTPIQEDAGVEYNKGQGMKE